ncbi:Ras family [Pelomyxa schiedti]|nr:Ras family [Pelomyxa schiedti]
MTHLYYRGAHGAMIVYDTTDRKSFLRMKEWYAELMENAPDTITVMIVANKIDLNNDATSPEEVDEFLHSVGHPLFERCSAQRGDNVTEAFTELCRQVLIVNPSLASV